MPLRLHVLCHGRPPNQLPVRRARPGNRDSGGRVSTQFSFKDDSFTVNRGRIEELCERVIAARLALHWECTTRVNLVTEDLLRKMKRAGCNSIKIGVESGSVDVLERMNKGITLEQVRQAGRLLVWKINHWTAFLIGTPGETGYVHKTLAFLYEIGPDFASRVYEPFRTPCSKICIRRGQKRDMALQDFMTRCPTITGQLPTGRKRWSLAPCPERDETRFIATINTRAGYLPGLHASVGIATPMLHADFKKLWWRNQDGLWPGVSDIQKYSGAWLPEA
jgi:hypothetical protein